MVSLYLIPMDTEQRINFRESKITADEEFSILFKAGAEAEYFTFDVIKCSDNKYLCLLSINHIITDAWSNSLLLNELIQTYNDLQSNKTLLINENTITFYDYAYWLHTQLEENVFIKQKKFWETYLKNLPRSTRIPHDDVTSDHIGASQQDVVIKGEDLFSLNVLSKEFGKSKFVLLTSIIIKLLHNYTNNNDIVVGIPYSGRSFPEMEKMLGCFINVLPLRINYTGLSTDLLNQLDKNIRAISDNHLYPFQDLIQEQSKRTHILINYIESQSLLNASFNDDKIRVKALIPERTMIDQDIHFVFREQNDRVILEIVHNNTFFSSKTITTIKNEFTHELQYLEQNLRQANTEKEEIESITEFNL